MKTKIILCQIICLIIFLIWGCGSTDSRKNELAQEEESRFNRINIENNISTDSIETERIKSKYNANSAWDTLSFTYQLEENLVLKGEFASVKADLNDILKKDSTYYIKIINKIDFYMGNPSNFDEVLLYLKINNNQFNLIKNIKLSHENSLGFGKTGIFIFKAKSINNFNSRVLDSNINESTGESSSEVNNTKALLINGDLIDFYLFRQ